MSGLLRLLTAAALSIVAFAAGINRATALDAADIEAEWATQLSKSVASPPERGEISVAVPRTPVPTPTPAVTLNRHLSLLVTDVDTVSIITFSAVMAQLAGQSGDALFTKEMLFHQWWDTQNKQPGLDLGPHCDDTPPQDKQKLSAYDCPRLEGRQAIEAAVFADEAAPTGSNLHAYSAIAFSNRFDLRSPPKTVAGGKVLYPDCGEYRIIFALNAGKTTPPELATDGKLHEGNIFDRNLISFEFRVPNPDAQPESPNDVAPAGCLPILKFWYSLSQSATGKIRGQRLVDFFMNGKMVTPDGQTIGQLPKVVDVRNLSFSGGQIRTDQFINDVVTKLPVPPHDYTPGTPGSITVTPNNWVLREYRTLMTNSRLVIVPDSTKTSPDTALFKLPTPGTPADSRLIYLINDIKDQAENLLGGAGFKEIGDINAIKYLLTKSVTNARQSVSGSPVPCAQPSSCNTTQLDNIDVAFNGNVDLATDIQDMLIAIKAPQGLTSSNIVDRLRTQTCAGCHQFSDTKLGSVGFDDPAGLGGNAHWPTKACGDYGPSCSLPSFIITDTTKLHPPMQFTQISEAVLVPAASDGAGHYRYAISSTAECMLDFREKVMKAALGQEPTSVNNCPK